MINKVKISIVLPTYNIEKYISRCLNSLQGQTFSDFEIIVVDDCGTDNTIVIVQEYAKRDERIIIIHNPKNIGTYHARRVGVENAKGEYIVFLDPDDELEKNLLELVYQEFLKSKAEILFYGVKFIPNFKWYNKKPYIYPKFKEKSLMVSYFSNGTNNYVWGTPGKAYERHFLIKVFKNLNIDKNFRFVYAEDVCLLINVMFYRPKYSILRYDGYIYYNNPTSITMQDPKKMNENIKQYDFMLENINKNIQNTNLTEDEYKIYQILKNKFLADKFLLIRNSGTKNEYFSRVLNSFLLIPSLSKILRLIIFVLTFCKKRL